MGRAWIVRFVALHAPQLERLRQVPDGSIPEILEANREGRPDVLVDRARDADSPWGCAVCVFGPTQRDVTQHGVGSHEVGI